MELEQIRNDFLSIVDLEEFELDKDTKIQLLKAVINNFFDYLAKK